MFSRQGNKRAVETFLVSKASVALFNTGSPDTNITDLTGGSVPKGTTLLADGQLGIFNASGYGTETINTSIDASPTKAENPVIYVAAGLPKDATTNTGVNMPYPLWKRPFERSGDINSNNWISATYQAYVAPQFSTWLVGNKVGSTGEINILDEQEYSIQIAEFGYANDIFYSSSATNVIAGSYVTPNYTALGTTNPVDHLVQNIAYEFNRNSRHLGIYNNNVFHGNSNVIAIALTPAAGTGTVVSTLTAGTVLTLVSNVNVGGQIVLTQEMADTIIAAVGSTAAAGWATTDKIMTIDLSTAGTNATGAEAILFVSLDRNPAYIDRIPFLKSTIRAGLTRGFDYATVLSEMTTAVDEGRGTVRRLEDQYRKTHSQRLYNLNHTEFPIIEFPTPFVANTKYDTFTIHHVDVNQIDTYNSSESPLKTIISIPNGDAVVGTFTTLLNAWLTAVGKTNIEVV